MADCMQFLSEDRLNRYLNGWLHAVSIGRPSEQISNIWMIRFLKTESKPNFSFKHTPYLRHRWQRIGESLFIIPAWTTGTKRRKHNLFVRSSKSEVEVTNNTRLRSTLLYRTIVANNWQIWSIMWPLCDSRGDTVLATMYKTVDTNHKWSLTAAAYWTWWAETPTQPRRHPTLLHACSWFSRSV